MDQTFYGLLRCPEDSLSLRTESSHGKQYLVCPRGHQFPIVRQIPRFVPKENYASSFGLQWNRYRQIQLDSFTGVPISRDRLTRLAGGSLEVFNGKTVLEEGCGAGRFTEILLDAGASVFAIDLSNAVEAAYKNFEGQPGYFVCQADILKPPVGPNLFDFVVCIGVVQHTPDPEATIAALCSYVKPGGKLIMDHYTYEYPMTLSRRILRAFLLQMPPTFSLRFCQFLVALLWPIHRILWIGRRQPGFRYVMRRLRSLFLRLSPLIDYQAVYPQLNPQLWRDWATLDTHDTLTDVYKHLRSPEEIAAHLHRCGMTDIEASYGGNGAEVRAKKPHPNNYIQEISGHATSR